MIFKIDIIFNILIVAFSFGFIIFLHEFAHFITAKRCGVKVEIFSLGFGRRILHKKIAATEYRISLIPLGGYVKMAGEDPNEKREGKADEFLTQPPGKRALIVFSGPLGNYILGFILFIFLFLVGYPTLGTKIGKIMEGYPAEKSELKTGDIITAVNGIFVSDWEELTKQIHPNIESNIVLTVKRNDEALSLNIKTIEKEIISITGKKTKIGVIGINPDSDDIRTLRYPPFGAIKKAGEKTILVTRTFFAGIANLILNKASLKESASGPIGIFYFSYKIVKIGLVYFVNFMALISISLALINLLPIPVLDGGHIFFIIIEKIRRKPVSIKVQEKCTQIGIAALLFLFVLITYFDIGRFFSK